LRRKNGVGKGEFIFAGKEAFFGDIGPLFAIPDLRTLYTSIAHGHGYRFKTTEY